MLIRRVLGGDRFWWLSMGLLRVVGTLVVLLSPMGRGFGSLFAWGGIILKGTLDLTQGLDPRPVFGRMFGMGKALSKTRFLVCLTLLDAGKRLLRIIWSILMVSSSGTLCLLA
jgi:hypothetical protein